MLALLLSAAFQAAPDSGGFRVDSLAVSASTPPRQAAALRRHVRTGPLDSALLRADLEGVVDSLVAEGHLLATASADSIDLDPAGTTRLHLGGRTGPRFSWSTLSQDGSRLAPYTLRRLARWQPGADADPVRIEHALARLEATGWVVRAGTPTIVREPRSLRLGAHLLLEDRPSSLFEAAGGWTTGEDATGHLLAQLANLAGTGRSLEFGIEKDGNGSRARVQATEPWLGPLDVSLTVGGQFQGDSLVHGTRLWTDLAGSPGDGALTVSVGLGWWRHAERQPGDTSFGEAVTETSTRLGLAGALGDADAFWPVRRLDGKVATETVHEDAHLGRVALAQEASATLPLAGPVAIQIRDGARGVWPLEPYTTLAEMSSPGGLDGWHGWREGAPWTPSWAWGAVEARLGTRGRGGLRAFWEPGVWWVRRPGDLEWEPRATWTAGGGVRWRAGAWELDALVAGERNTPTWEDALVHLRARNRF